MCSQVKRISIMYVCLCNAVSDTDIKDAIDRGAADLGDIQTMLGAGTGCGGCREFTQELIEQSRSDGAAQLAYSA